MFYDFCELIVLAHIFPRLPFHVGTQNYEKDAFLKIIFVFV